MQFFTKGYQETIAGRERSRGGTAGGLRGCSVLLGYQPRVALFLEIKLLKYRCLVIASPLWCSLVITCKSRCPLPPQISRGFFIKLCAGKVSILS